jgi:hypothetical protein
MLRDGEGDRVFVARHACDDRGAGDSVRVEFLHPAVGERLGLSRLVPVQLPAQVGG